ncbi:MAG: GntR family transcriptional regulator [Clostridia bacterium]|nr:GntR family transcriptional regulator [Clostridia bacterium]
MEQQVNRPHQMISLADQVFDALETDILSGVYERGEFLTESRLSEKMAVSRTPIREALKRLATEHIIEMTPRGARVIGILPADIADIYDIRLQIEGMAVARAAQNMSGDAIRELKETLDLQEFYTLRKEPDLIKNMDSRFHRIIYENCGSGTFKDILGQLHRKIMKYRRVSISTPSRATESLSEHNAIYEAIAARDSKKAEELTITHIQHARKHILDQARAGVNVSAAI